ncbi:glycosyltransferase [Adlercreutzia sp. ZJ304]|uniref:glycosyltransferase family 2 protein n=1 Tax=Adlercreutzia sp. ZJ304 TaxID=2709791 RepID=UPI0013EDCE56|nr:glycosyltransferase [Adlercreutzia sp. ZJ304]
MNATQFDIAAIVVTYNSDCQKTLNTIASILMQQNVRFEIIIADDGSRETNFACIYDYFERAHFKNYKLLTADENVGTVRNCIAASNYVNSRYVKTISPGDYLYAPNVLEEIVTKMDSSNANIGFGAAIYYSDGVDNIEIINKRNPIVINPYKRKCINNQIIARNMIGFGDFILGALPVFRTLLWKCALAEILGSVTYCEDYSIQLMVYKGEKILYIDQFTVWYEYGTGISTSLSENNKNRIMQDAKSFCTLFLNKYPDFKYRKQMKERSNQSQAKTIRNKISLLFRRPSEFVFRLRSLMIRAFYKCKNFDIQNYKMILELGHHPEKFNEHA